MGHSGKYGKIITEYGSIPEDEPVILFRAKDILILDVLGDYLAKCAKAGAPPAHMLSLLEEIDTIQNWQRSNYTKVPDTDA